MNAAYLGSLRTRLRNWEREKEDGQLSIKIVSTNGYGNSRIREAKCTAEVHVD
jgi:hypothetical protein